MREIKFRAWHKEKRIMITVCILDFMRNADGSPRQNCEGYYEDNLRIHFGLHEVELMQFTCLHDCEGKEIYADDIVEVDEHYCGDCKILKTRGVIKYEAPEFFILPNDSISYLNLWDAAVNNGLTILGDIHQHSELLKD